MPPGSKAGRVSTCQHGPVNTQYAHAPFSSAAPCGRGEAVNRSSLRPLRPSSAPMSAPLAMTARPFVARRRSPNTLIVMSIPCFPRRIQAARSGQVYTGAAPGQRNLNPPEPLPTPTCSIISAAVSPSSAVKGARCRLSRQRHADGRHHARCARTKPEHRPGIQEVGGCSLKPSARCLPWVDRRDRDGNAGWRCPPLHRRHREPAGRGL
jgi:hypothetical protein